MGTFGNEIQHVSLPYDTVVFVSLLHSPIHRYSCCQVFVVLAFTCQRPFHPFTMVLCSHAIPTQPSTHHRFLFTVVAGMSRMCAHRG